MEPPNEELPSALQPFDLDLDQTVWIGRIPAAVLGELPFERLWNLHPDQRPMIRMLGRLVQIPRWQQAYGRDYQFSGQVSTALPIPPMLQPLLDWACTISDPRLNGLLLNWYDGTRKDYIGAHRDSITDLVPGTPIATVSFGDARTFRFSRRRDDGQLDKRDFTVSDGLVLVMSWEVNQRWKHGVPHHKGNESRRISVTFRAFATV